MPCGINTRKTIKQFEEVELGQAINTYRVVSACFTCSEYCTWLQWKVRPTTIPLPHFGM